LLLVPGALKMKPTPSNKRRNWGQLVVFLAIATVIRLVIAN